MTESNASSSTFIKEVPTNIITGFLGVGKTSTILHLLANKPASERWAILVNEFGEIGIDGNLIEGNQSNKQGVFIREVPGGCMCCTSGLPMQVALTQLISKAKPDRLLIEPTGLGHPQEVLETLSSDNYKGILNIQKIITLVDARKVSDKRYSEHETFQQQIKIADIIIANKQDLYEQCDRDKLQAYINVHCSDNTNLVFTQQGAISQTLLDGTTNAAVHNSVFNAAVQAPSSNQPSINLTPIPECGYLKATNESNGFKSIGWRFESKISFDKDKLFIFLNGIVCERLKAVFNTEQGAYSYNLTSDALTEIMLENCDESRIEIIATDINEQLEDQLLDCIIR